MIFEFKGQGQRLQNITVQDFLKEEIQKSKDKVIACRINNEVKPLNYILKDDDKVSLIDISEKIGIGIYIKGLLYIMGKAFKNLYPEADILVNHQLNNSMYCQVEHKPTTEEMIKRVEAEMQKIIEEDLPIRKVEFTRRDGEKFYKENATTRGKLQLENRSKKKISLYFCEDYYNYFYGVLPISTGYTDIFEMIKYEKGFLIRYPSRKETKKLTEYKETKKLLTTLQEYEDIHDILEVKTVYQLNEIVRNGKANDLILLDEALHEKKIAQIADKVAKNRKVKMVLIAGPSSSGKTTFARRLGIQLRLNGLKIVTISVDNYFVERENTPKDENGQLDFEAIEAIDLELFNRDITALLNGEEIDMPTFDFIHGKKVYNGKKMKLADDEILVMEGIHCLNDRLTSSIPRDQKYKIYISALAVLNLDRFNRISTTDTRLIRRIVRDNQFRGYSALKTLKTWASVNRGEEKNIFPYQEEADCMFNTSLIYEISALKNYALPLLRKIKNTEDEYAEAKRLCKFLEYFEPIKKQDVFKNSLLKEFLGGSIFDE
ncbi:MAG: nucleoside kinase [Clostridia bacterium]|nr:nucleoside kinase [Clostridia bacterium]